MNYYNLVNGKYERDPNGILCGIEWSDVNDNQFRAVVFMPDFSTLQYGQEVKYIYSVEINPNGLNRWIPERNETITVSNSQYLNTEQGGIVDIDEATIVDSEGNRVIKPGYAKQLDFFISSVCKGIEGVSVPIYQLMIKEIKKREGIA